MGIILRDKVECIQWQLFWKILAPSRGIPMFIINKFVNRIFSWGLSYFLNVPWNNYTILRMKAPKLNNKAEAVPVSLMGND